MFSTKRKQLISNCEIIITIAEHENKRSIWTFSTAAMVYLLQ